MKSPYLRISVNSSCNLNCYFCHSDGNNRQDQELNRGDILLATKLSKKVGMEKIKLTGGEPLLRKDICKIISDMKKIHPYVDLSMITNGTELAKRASEISKAGLDRVTVSLDSLDPENYSKICGSDRLEEVKMGLEEAKKAGLDPVKLNVVLSKHNITELEKFVDFANSNGYMLRFLEMIPYNEKAKNAKISEESIHNRLMDIFDDFEDINEHGTQLLLYRSGENQARVKKKVVDPGEGDYLRLTADSILKPNLNEKGSIELRKNGIPETNFHSALRSKL